MRHSVVGKVGGMRELAHAHDMEMWLRIASVSDVGHLSGCDQAWHREHSASLSRSNNVMTDLRERAGAFRTLFSEAPGEDENAKRLWLAARRALAEESSSRALSAYIRGRGDSSEVQSYLEFAEEMDVPLDQVLGSVLARRALGRRRSLGRIEPSFIAHAIGFRARRILWGKRWRMTGL